MHTRIILATLFAACPLAAFAQDAVPSPAPAAPPAAFTAPAAQAVTLRYKFAPGQTRRYKITMTINGTMLTGQSGAGIPLNTMMVMTLRQTVKDVRASDGAATIEAQLESIQMSMNGKEMALPPQQQAQMKKIYTSLMLPTGKVLSVQMPPMPTGNMMGMDFGKSLMTSSVAFPDAPVKVGDIWNGTTAIGLGGMNAVNMIMTSTLAGIDTAGGTQLATLAQTLHGDLNVALSKNIHGSMKMTGKIMGVGTQVFDVTAGAIAKQSTDINTNFLMKFSPPAGGAAPAGMPQEMKMTLTQNILMERLDDSVPTLAPVQ